MIVDGNNQEKQKSCTIFWHRKCLAYLMFAGSVISISLGVAAVQAFGDGIGIFQLTSLRFSAIMVLTAPLICRRRCKLSIAKSEWISFPVLVLSISSFYTAYFWASYYVPIGTLAGLNAAVTIASSSTLSICLRNERKWQLYLASFVSLIGVLLLLQPDVLFGFLNLPPPPEHNYTCECVVNVTVHDVHTEEHLYVGYLLSILSGLSMTTAFRLFRRITQKVDPSVIAFHTSVEITIISAILMFIFEEPKFPMTSYCIFLLMFQCIGTAIYFIILPYCLRIIHPSVLIIVRAVDLPIQLIFQYTFMRSINPGKQNLLEILGGLVCFIGCCIGPCTNLLNKQTNDEARFEHQKEQLENGMPFEVKPSNKMYETKHIPTISENVHLSQIKQVDLA